MIDSHPHPLSQPPDLEKPHPLSPLQKNSKMIIQIMLLHPHEESDLAHPH